MMVTLIGLDFGSTTSSAVVARARIVQERGRVEIRDVRETFRSAMAMTPFVGELLDEEAIGRLVDGWLTTAGVRAEEVFGGGAIVTGLAAQRANAGAIARLVRARLRQAVIATAEDPHLESWLSFMGSAAALSRRRPETPILNLDIGGGTTNLALGRAGEVIATSAVFVGARHIEVEPGTYRITRLSEHAERWLSELKIAKGRGETLSEYELSLILDYLVAELESEVARLATPETALCYSGGVGEMIHVLRAGEAPFSRSCYGDLGGELASRIVRSDRLSRRVLSAVGGGRATSYGLLRHTTHASGATLFLPSPEVLPLVDLPILGHLSSASTEEEIERLFGLVGRSAVGGCLTVTLGEPSAAAVRAMGRRLAAALRAGGSVGERAMVLICRENAAKALGGYATEWGKIGRGLVVVDEIEVDPGAHFVQIGHLRDTVVPVSFHGMTPERT